MKTKKCPKCKIEKPLDAEHYHRDKSRTTGFSYNCRICRNKAGTQRYKQDPTVRERMREYSKKNRLKINEQARNRRRENPEYHRSYQKKYDSEHREEAKLRQQKVKAKQPGCIYQIVNSVNNKVYIGQTMRGELRWKKHTSALRGNRHANHKIQADFNKFGEDAFEWSIIKEYPKDKDTLLLEEARTIVKYRKEGKDLYNLTLTIDQVQLLEENK